MDEDRWDPLNDVLPSPESDVMGTNDVTVAPAENPQAINPPEANPAEGNPSVGNPQTEPQTPPPDQRNMTGGAVLPNNAQELGADEVEESDIESFPASDAPAW